MQNQPGLISAQLHRGIAGSGLFMNYIVWESVDAFRRGFELGEFQAQLNHYPPGTVVSASFFQRVAVPGMCLGEGTSAAQCTRAIRLTLFSEAALLDDEQWRALLDGHPVLIPDLLHITLPEPYRVKLQQAQAAEEGAKRGGPGFLHRALSGISA